MIGCPRYPLFIRDVGGRGEERRGLNILTFPGILIKPLGYDNYVNSNSILEL